MANFKLDCAAKKRWQLNQLLCSLGNSDNRIEPSRFPDRSLPRLGSIIGWDPVWNVRIELENGVGDGLKLISNEVDKRTNSNGD